MQPTNQPQQPTPMNLAMQQNQASPSAAQQLQDMLSREDLDSLEKLNITNHVLTKLQDSYAVGTEAHEEAKSLYNNYKKSVSYTHLTLPTKRIV